ncbi:1-phosphofructokinase family hexose kinase [soil metagenome]
MLIAGPNLTIDRTLRIADLRPGEVLRFDESHVTAGGKGVNVARAARALGVPATLVGFTPGRTGAAVAGLIEDEGLAVVPVPVSGEVRSAAVILERSGRVTVLNEPGPKLREGDWERYEEAVVVHLAGHRVVVASGSLPPAAPPEAYARLVAAARRAGAQTIVDASGVHLEHALAARPEVACPNLGEAEKLLGLGAGGAFDEQGAEVVQRALRAAMELHERGADTAVVTAGGAGAALALAGRARHLPAARVAVTNPIGAGDAFASGLAAGIEDGRPRGDAVAYGMACAAAVVEVGITGTPARARIEELYGRFELEGRPA